MVLAHTSQWPVVETKPENHVPRLEMDPGGDRFYPPEGVLKAQLCF
jgi:hypothetical protein